MVYPIPCEAHGEAWCGTCAIASRESAGRRRLGRAVVDSGVILVVVGVIVCLLAWAAKAEEAARTEPVRDVPAGVVCAVPGVARPVPLPAGGKVVPPDAWARIDAELRRLQDADTRAQAREAELERQFTDRLVQALTGGAAAGIVVGALVGWLAASVKPPP